MSGLIFVVKPASAAAAGVVVVILEDDTGTVNGIVWPDLPGRYRKEVPGARRMTVDCIGPVARSRGCR